MKHSILRSLHFKVATGVIVTVVVLSAIYILVDYRTHRQQALVELEQSSGIVSRFTLQAVVEVAMRGQHLELLQRAVESLANDPSVASIDLVDSRGVVRFSSVIDRLGRAHRLDQPSCVVCHQGDPDEPPSSVYFERDGQEVMRRAIVLRNQEECHACHDPDEKTLGLLLIDYRPDQFQQLFRSKLGTLLLQGGLAVVAILLVLGLLMNRLVINPVQSLALAAERIRRGDFTARVEVSSGDELGMLGQTLNQTARGLAVYRQQAEEREQIRVSLLRKLVNAQEEERKTVARELHDQLGQSLSAALLSVQRNCDFSSDKSSRCYDVTARIGEAIDQVHDLARGIRPPTLDEFGLESALEQHITEVASESGIRIDYEHSSPPDADRMSAEVELTLYRITQEALTNVVRHSNSSRASVVLLRRQAGVTLLIEDKGSGFATPRDGKPAGGLGLTGIQERAVLLGGKATIVSAPGEGTTVRIQVPLVEKS